MNFRNDEIVQESDDDSINSEESQTQGNEGEEKSEAAPKEKDENTQEKAYSLVNSVETKMMDISNVLSSMDKRMAYNLRLISSVTHGCHEKFHKDS